MESIIFTDETPPRYVVAIGRRGAFTLGTLAKALRFNTERDAIDAMRKKIDLLPSHGHGLCVEPLAYHLKHVR